MLPAIPAANVGNGEDDDEDEPLPIPKGPPACERFPVSPICGCTIPCRTRLRKYEAAGVVLAPPAPADEDVSDARVALPRCPRDTLTVLTWNVWFSHAWAGARWRSILTTTAHLAPDIICFQESTPSFARLCTAEPWVKAGYATSDDEMGFGRSCAPEGELLLVRSELAPSFSVQPLPSSDQDRELVCASLGSGLQVGTAHFESMQCRAVERYEQFLYTAQQFRSASRAIVCGDFNLHSADEDAALKKALGSTWADAWTSARPKDDGWTVDPLHNRLLASGTEKGERVMPRRFDRILLQGLVCSRAQLVGTDELAGLPGVWPSDHFGVFAEVSAQRDESAAEGATSICGCASL